MSDLARQKQVVVRQRHAESTIEIYKVVISARIDSQQF
jgi:hypothetical protein